MLTAIDANRIAKDLFGVSGSFTQLPSEYDTNYHIKTETGEEFLLKISRAHEDKSVIELQNAVLHWLQTKMPPLLFPKLNQTITGEWIGCLNLSDGTKHWVRLFGFISANLLTDIPDHSPALLENLGSQLGYLSLALANFEHESAQRIQKWDLLQSHWVRDELSHLENTSDRDCVEYFYPALSVTAHLLCLVSNKA